MIFPSITEVVLRDGQQSLIASRMRTNENVGKTYTKVNNLILPNEEWINGYDDVTKLQTNIFKS